MGAAGRIVAEGRDTGTVVFPGAAWKFYLDAGLAERVSRRIKQLRHRGETVDEDEIFNQIVKRDRDDMERSLAPLKAAPDAVRINSTDLGPDDVLARMLAVIRRNPIKG
ncbi:MAG: (d)CMP kinase, partial [Proteobacteria bacterium]|nr:(d)CMP kinase [Pseudomonadota bacterium]